MIKTKRLLLRPLTMRDADAVYQAYSSAADEYRFTRIPWPYKRIHAVEFISSKQRERRKGISFSFGIFDKANRTFMGELNLKNIDNENKCAEMGYSIGTSYRNKGFVTEAANALIGYVFKQMKLNRITLFCDVRNTASKRVMEKLGAMHEGIARERVFIKGKFCDEHQYSILKKEWK